MTAIAGSRVAIVGGSIAGCAAASALGRAGCDTTVYERHSGELQDRGFGVVIPVPLRDELVSAGYVNPAMPLHEISERLWIVRDADTSRARVLWRQPFVAAANNWAILWRTLRVALPDEAYLSGRAISNIETIGNEATIVTDDRRSDRFDIVVGADGYQSAIRPLIDPESRPEYAGYVLWRGNYPESRLADRVPQELENAGVTVCFPGGHGIFYLVPDFDQGRRRINWAVYNSISRQSRFDKPTSLPPGSVDYDLAQALERILTEHFPAPWADVVRHTPRHELSLQPIYDATISRYVSDRVMLIGDAGALARPHTGAGATKALQDALTLERACHRHDAWSRVLSTYNEERCPAGNTQVQLGRRLGRAQVEDTPSWDRMTPEDFETWMHTTLAGQHTFYNHYDGNS